MAFLAGSEFSGRRSVTSTQPTGSLARAKFAFKISGAATFKMSGA